MVLANQPLHIHGAPTHLLPVYVADQRLVARIFLAHAASLRYMIFFARQKFGRFLHSFVLRLQVLTCSPLFFLLTDRHFSDTLNVRYTCRQSRFRPAVIHLWLTPAFIPTLSGGARFFSFRPPAVESCTILVQRKSL